LSKFSPTKAFARLLYWNRENKLSSLHDDLDLARDGFKWDASKVDYVPVDDEEEQRAIIRQLTDAIRHKQRQQSAFKQKYG
jgi:hypothetical protein